MRRWLCALCLTMIPLLAAAAPVKITTGEHEGFTRLVIEYAGPVDWTVGRALDGYGLSLKGESPLYDLSGVFDIIGKSRLASIWVDPETQVLRIGIACACHAMPFEFRPGIVVIDLKDGPPPKGSSFELGLGDVAVTAFSPRPNPRPRSRPALAQTEPDSGLAYNWLAALPPQRPKPAIPASMEMTHESPDSMAHDLMAPNPSETGPFATDLTLQPLRDQLLRQMSRGAAQGMIDMALPEVGANIQKGAAFPSAQVRIGEMPGLIAGAGLPAHDGLAANGRVCTSAEALDFATWGDARPVFEQMAEAMTGLTGEFDRAEPEAVRKAIRFNLFLGFGAEAIQLSQAFPTEDADSAVWIGLAHLIDDEPDPTGAFADQADCDTPAALWAILANPSPEKGERRDARAALLAFSALPLHLRRHLGARLADQFMAMGETESARAVRDAILRAPGEAGAKVDLMQARMELDAGDPEAAEARAVEVLTDAGPNAGEALITLVESRVAQKLPVEESVALALDAMIVEQQGTPDEARFQRALVLAKAASGDFDAALAIPDTSVETGKLVWALLANIGEDEALLNHAVLGDAADLPEVEVETAARIGARLVGLGFPDQALRWLMSRGQFDPLLVAKAQLQRQDAKSAMMVLAEETSAEALMMRAEALQLLGEEAEAAEVFAQAGDPEAGWRATGRAHDWPRLAEFGPDPWKRAAASVEGPVASAVEGSAAPDAVEGPLARSRRLADGSAATREALNVLLASVPFPATDGQ